jgi:hypothetical protein
MWKKILVEFLLGGMLIAFAIAIGMLIDPVFGGLIAALPIRLGATIFLGGMSEGEKFALKMVEGSLLTYIGTFFFLVALRYFIPRLGLATSFVISSIICVAIIILTFKITGKI